jgi:hypothetical protein
MSKDAHLNLDLSVPAAVVAVGGGHPRWGKEEEEEAGRRICFVLFYSSLVT